MDGHDASAPWGNVTGGFYAALSVNGEGVREWLHRSQQLDALFERRVRVEHVVQRPGVVGQRVDEVEVARRLGRGVERVRVAADLLQRARQALWVAR